MIKPFLFIVPVVAIIAFVILDKKESNNAIRRAALPFGCTAWDGLKYKFSYFTSGDFDFAALQGGPAHKSEQVSQIEGKAEGELTTMCLDEALSARSQMYMRLSVTVAEFSGNLAAASSFRDSSYEIVLDINKDDGSLEIIYHQAMPRLEEHIFRDMIGQMVLIDSSQLEVSDSLNQIEADSQGKYRADYLIERGTDYATISKSRHYIAASSKQETKQEPKQEQKSMRALLVPASATKATYAKRVADLKSWQMNSLASDLSFDFLLGQKKVGSSKSILKLDTVKELAGDDLLKLRDRMQQQTSEKNSSQQVRDDLTATRSFTRLRQGIQRRELGELAVPTLISWIRQISQEELAPKGPASAESPLANQIFLKTRAMLRVEPGSAQEIAKLFADMTSEDSRFGPLALAFRSAGNAESQEALWSAMKQHQDRDSQRYLISQLGQFNEPTESVSAALEGLSRQAQDDEIRQTAFLARSNVARTLHQQTWHQQKGGGDAAYFQRTVDEGMSLIGDCTDSASCLKGLSIVGNLGTHEALATAKALSSHPDPSVQREALSLLRFVSGSEALEYLLTILNSATAGDQNRVQAAIELSYRPVSAQWRDQLPPLLAKESSPQVRQQVVNLLGHALEVYPEVVKIIEATKRSDPNAEVRAQATAILLR